MEECFGTLFAWLLGIFVLTIVGLFVIYAVVSEKREKATERIKKHPDGPFDDIQISVGLDKKGFAINTERRKVLLIAGETDRSIDFEQIVEVELLRDDTVVSSAKRGSQFAGALVGGAALGGAGAIIGGLSGKRVSGKGNLQSISVKLVVDCLNDPVHHVIFYRDVTGKGLPAWGAREIIERAERWAARFAAIIKENDRVDRSSEEPGLNAVSDELERLLRLRDSGALSEDEFQAAKRRVLGV